MAARQELCSRSDVISKVTLCTSSQDVISKSYAQNNVARQHFDIVIRLRLISQPLH
ncbi:hypothetical protein V6760_11195 [Acinetobacter venetianus]